MNTKTQGLLFMAPYISIIGMFLGFALHQMGLKRFALFVLALLGVIAVAGSFAYGLVLFLK